jgi:Mandelate racemase / muconate lactonizing enzyme, N-terminal domain
MKIASLETLVCDAGWRPWIFLKATAADGLVGRAEITDSHGSPRGLVGIVEDLAPLVVGRDPRAGEAAYWDLYRATRQSPGSVIAKAIAGIENAMLDLKAKALGVPVNELFGGPLRHEVPVYWSHCGTTRARAWRVTGTRQLASYEDVTALSREVVQRGFSAFKTSVVVRVTSRTCRHPGFHGAGLERNSSRDVEASLQRLLDAFAVGTEGNAEPIVDLNFNLTTEGPGERRPALGSRPRVAGGRLLRPPGGLAFVRPSTSIPICSWGAYVNEDVLRAHPWRAFHAR